MNNNQKTFSKKAALTFAFEALKNNFGILSLITILMFGATLLISTGLLFYSKNFLQIATNIITILSCLAFFAPILPLVFLSSFCLTALKIIDKEEKASFNDCIPKFILTWKVLVIYLLASFIIHQMFFLSVIFILG